MVLFILVEIDQRLQKMLEEGNGDWILLIRIGEFSHLESLILIKSDALGKD